VTQSFTPHLGYVTFHEGAKPLGEGPIMAFPVYPVADIPGGEGAAELIIKMGDTEINVWLPAAQFWGLGTGSVPGVPKLPGGIVAVVFTEDEEEDGAAMRLTLRPVALHVDGKFVPCYQTEQEALSSIAEASA
jgi:hypothetical protein